MHKPFCLLLVIFANSIAVLASLPAFALDKNVTFYSELYPPANFIEQGELKGITVDTLKAMWHQLEIPEQSIEVVPWSRGYRFTLNNPNTALFTMSRTHAREGLFKWVGPVFHSTHVLMAKKSKQFAFNSLGEVFAQRVAAVNGDISEISLLQVGFPSSNMAKVKDLETAFKMLNADRVDMIVVTIHGFAYLSQQLGVDANNYVNVWEVSKVGNYIAFNLHTSDEVIKQYQQAFNEISEQRLTIKEKYALPTDEY